MPRQTSFAAGELSPLMWGRTDSSMYGAGVRKLRNFFVSQQGAAVSRPGSLFVSEARPTVNNTPDSVPPPRLVPFVVSHDRSWVLEVGTRYTSQRYLRVWKLSGTTRTVEATFELETFGDHTKLHFAQYGTAMIITGPIFNDASKNNRPYVLQLGSGGWSLSILPIGVPPAQGFPDDPIAHPSHGFSVDSGGAALPLPVLVDDGALFFVDAAHPPREWRYLMTTLLRHKTTGELAETLPAPIVSYITGSDFSTVAKALSKMVVYPDKPVVIREATAAYTAAWDFTQPPTALSDWDVDGYCFYRGRGDFPGNGTYGLIGRVGVGFGDFTDNGDEPNYGISPPANTQPFWSAKKVDGFWDDILYVRRVGSGLGNPSLAGFFESRLVFAGFPEELSTLLFSATGAFRDFDTPLQPLASQSLQFSLAAQRCELVRHVLPGRKLLVFTASSGWQFSGANGGALAPDNVVASVIDNLGTSEVPPLMTPLGLLVVRPSGRQVALLTPDGDGGYQARDISTHAQHLLSSSITSWCYAGVPWGAVWLTLADGALLSLTISASGAAWARHDSKASDAGADVTATGVEQAKFRSLCSVPENNEDAVYALVERKVTAWVTGIPSNVEQTRRMYTIERLATRDALVTDGQCSVDAAVSVALQVGDGTPGATQTLTGLPAHFVSKKVWLVTKRNAPVELTVSATGTAAVPASALAVGDNGSTSPGAAVVGWVGFRFVCQMELLDVGAGDARLHQKTTVAVGVEVDSSIGLEVGQDFGHLSAWKQRTPADSYASPSAATELVQMPVSRTWDKSARAVLQQATPRPLTVLGVTREVDGGGR